MPSAPQARATNSANKTCLIIALMIVGLIVVFCGFFAFMMNGVKTQFMSTASCTVMFEMSQKAALAYAKEHNGLLPDASKWEQEIAPYYERLYNKMADEVKGVWILQDSLPPAPGSDLQCKWNGRVTAIAMNQALSGAKLAAIKEPTKTVLFFETDRTGKNLAMKYVPMPKSTAPKLLNEERDWIVYYIDGNKNPLDSSSSSSKSIEITTDDALTPKDEPPTAKDK
jgi:hypothetical protein